ncbi:hypothetical protein B1T47_05885, partial [Mycobacterium kansasii]|uniref:PPE domain-containing protein n=1 Tax=Mycobacterium kansasii TaxID=1768 RepID=UPI0009EF7ADB
MEFLTLPPEVNSARILRGPGPAPLRAAATAWATLSEDLASSATAVSSVMSEISGSAWQGPAAAAMAAAVAPYPGGVGAADRKGKRLESRNSAESRMPAS